MKATRPDCPRCGTDGKVKIKEHRNGRTRYLCTVCGRSFTCGAEDGAPGFYEDGNYATAISDRRAKIPTVDSVLEEYGVDRNEWLVDKVTPKYHEMGYKDDAGRGHVLPLYALQIDLVRRRPVAVKWPQFRAAKVRRLKPRRFAISRQLARRIIMPDVQGGFAKDQATGELDPLHDPLACDVFARVVQALQPDGLDHIGDGLDFAECSDKYTVRPEFYWTMQPSLDWFASYLAWLRNYVGPRESEEEFRYLEGNHEERLTRKILQNFIAAANLRRANAPDEPPVVSVPFLLRLNELKIKFIDGYPRNRAWITRRLQLRHAGKLSSKPGGTAGNSLQGASCSSLHGHSHRLESAHYTRHPQDGPSIIGSYNVGTLSRLDGRVPSNAAEENQQQGFAVVDHARAGDDFQVYLVNIIDGTCIFEGRRFEAETETADFKEDCNG